MAARIFFLTLSLVLYISPFIFGYSSNDIKTWCRKTPNPKPCEDLLSHNTNQTPIKQKSQFFLISSQLSLDQAMHAHTNVASLGSKFLNPKAKAAWADCLKLYDHTIQKLNTIVNPSIKCTQEDAQTWLSTSLTNLETCREGFSELGVSDLFPPAMSNNVSDLISNTLSINNVPYNPTPAASQDGFPTWVNPCNRCLLQTSSSPAADLVVAKDGSGNYKTVAEAVTAASKRSGTARYVIYVKAGTYKENVAITSKNIMLMGDGIGKTVITGSKSVGGGSTTFNSATVAVTGDGFIARDITFQNTAGSSNNQAVALRSGSDLSVFYKCSFEGFQDTLYVYSDRQFYRECDIYGTVDFIFGNAAVVLQNCNIYVHKHKTNTVTAQGRSDPNQNTGISIHNCKVNAASDLDQSASKTYLGRPWRQYSRTVFIKTYLGGLVNAAGWLEWDGDFALKTLYYGEYGNSGPGSSTSSRVKWEGYHVITSSTEASKFTVGNFIAGSSWLPATNVPFTAGLEKVKSSLLYVDSGTYITDFKKRSGMLPLFKRYIGLGVEVTWLMNVSS